MLVHGSLGLEVLKAFVGSVLVVVRGSDLSDSVLVKRVDNA